MKEIVDANYEQFPDKKEFIITTDKVRYKANSLDDVMWLFHYNVKSEETVLDISTIGQEEDFKMKDEKQINWFWVVVLGYTAIVGLILLWLCWQFIILTVCNVTY